ncbi:hypothetical protein G5C64_23150 [Vibrio diabolicus]|uniref:hypothetical protein n=1 Tax=Vibrio TaxID=662 RepID=UPI002150A817|nr:MULTISPECIES: hypothetical protein [Vibrio]MCE3221691.1 hypothetical protein [Vibrio diabolicus]MDW1763146.1 hypothetical protein [Vibrio sp. Vb2135]MDW2333018.1 hypothetical protein [Vibrio sp. 1069]HCH5255487.1 hypothetical protein [Vibrio parahaemolyticus]
MQSTLNKPSDYYMEVVEVLKQRVKGVPVYEYALYGEYQVKGLECHVAIDEYGALSKANDGRIKQPVRVKVYCLVSRAYSDTENRNADLIAQDLASAVGRIAFNNNFGLGKTVSFPEKIVSQQGMFKSGTDGYECWETEWWQNIYLGDLPEEDPKVLGIFLAINPTHPEKPDEYKELENASFNPANRSS